MRAELEEKFAEVTASEFPLERAGHGFVVLLEVQEPLLELGKGAEVVGCQHLALDDGEIDLDLVEPTGVNRRIHWDNSRPAPLQALHARLAAMRGAVVHDPEDPARGAVGFLAHNLVDQATEGCDAGPAFATAKELGALHVPGGEVGPGAPSSILMFDAHAPTWGRWQGGMAPPPCLDAGLLVGREDEVGVRQRLSLPSTLVEVEDQARLRFEGRIAGKNPTAMGPGADGILREPTPQSGLAHRGHDPAFEHRALDLGKAPARQRHTRDVG